MKIKFLPQNIEVEGSPNKSLLQIATENQLEIRSICKGVPSCAECRVRIVEGDNNVLPPGKAELGLIGTSYFIDNRRLSCQVRCFGDVTIDLTEQVERAENQTKKIRGFRSNKQVESKAVNDTMLLNEKVEEQPSQQQAQSSNQQQPREHKHQGGGQQQQQSQQRQQNKQQPPQQRQQKQQQKPQQQAQGKQQNQNQKQSQQNKGSKDNRGPQQPQGRDPKKPGSNQP
ncbi:MAG: 2Fe-2S iron-sulfur cluster-binding protein [Bdellovibrio sp.]